MDVHLDAENVIMPIDVIHRLIDESKYIHIMNECVCRTGGRCTHHRHDIGCMFLGASGLDVAPPLSHPATREEAYAHVDAAIADGLVPQTMRIRADNYAFMFPDHHTVVAVCFCCDCCCYTQFYRDAPRTIVDRVYHRPDGVHVRFDVEKCRRCTERACVSHCYMHALSVIPEGTIAVSGDCRTCGRCARVCPNGPARLGLGTRGEPAVGARLAREHHLALPLGCPRGGHALGLPLVRRRRCLAARGLGRRAF